MISEKSSSAQFNKHEITDYLLSTAWKHLPGKWTGTERLEPHLFSSAAAYELNTETPQSY